MQAVELCELRNFIDLTLKLKLHLDIVEMYVCTKLKLLPLTVQKI